MRRDRGQATVLLLACVTLLVVVMVALAHFGGRVAVHEHAQAAADAAALAGVVGGRPAAARVAALNGGELVSFRALDAMTVEVAVRVAGSAATARATRAP